MNSIKSKSEVKNIDFFYGKSVTDLINLRVYIKKIYFKFRISKGSCYVFDKFYAEHLNKNLKTERSISFVDKKNFPHLTMYGKIDLTEYRPPGDIVTGKQIGRAHV